jgi:hypothetical protein
MDDAEFQAHVDDLPPGMRFMVNHVVQLSLGVFALFGALLIAVLAAGVKERAVIAIFCVVAMVMALINLTIFRVARNRLMSSGNDEGA